MDRHLAELERGDSGWVRTHLVPLALWCLLGRRLLGWAAPMRAGDVPREVVEDLNLPENLPVTLLHGAEDQSAPLSGEREHIVGAGTD